MSESSKSLKSPGFSIVVMVVSGSGKSTVGEMLASALSATFIDGDDLHPRANVQKMAKGDPLDDDDRAPWLTRINDAVYNLEQRSRKGVIVCSALKKRYRDKIREDNQNLLFVFLDGPKHVILDRMATRAGHFMKPDMLDSQFAALERPGINEHDVLTVTIDTAPDAIVERVIGLLSERGVSVANS